jgi:hypothetical protein
MDDIIGSYKLCKEQLKNIIEGKSASMIVMIIGFTIMVLALFIIPQISYK